MSAFPENYELIGFFEAEPSLADPGIPWFYNRLTFRTERGPDTVICQLEPACGELALWWQQDGKPRANLKLNRIGSVSVHMARNDDYLLVSGDGAEPGTLLKLRLKPHVSIEIECWNEP